MHHLLVLIRSLNEIVACLEIVKGTFALIKRSDLAQVQLLTEFHMLVHIFKSICRNLAQQLSYLVSHLGRHYVLEHL